MAEIPSELRPRFRWPALFQHSATPLFVLNRGRRLRFVNAAWERLTGLAAADVAGRACVRKGPTEPLFRTLAPPPETIAGRTMHVRRPAPPNLAGPPWWDVTFVPLSGTDGAVGFLGLIQVVPANPAVPPKSIPAVVATLRSNHAAAFTLDLFPANSPATERLQARIRHAAQTTAALVIVGEPGTGKETLARVIHHTGTQRERPFIAFDCVGLQPYLIDSLLFGPGGLATAGRIGTLVLKSPAALPRDLQQRLADWLLTAVDAPRLICTTATPPADDAAAGMLRLEFSTALAVLELAPLPLRDRLDELLQLAERCIDGTTTFSPDFLVALAAHQWPGNLRELRVVVRDAVHRADGGTATAKHLPRFLQERALIAADPPVKAPPAKSMDAILEAVETRLIALALAKANGNQTEAAALLGIFRTRLGRRIDALGIGIGKGGIP